MRLFIWLMLSSMAILLQAQELKFSTIVKTDKKIEYKRDQFDNFHVELSSIQEANPDDLKNFLIQASSQNPESAVFINIPHEVNQLNSRILQAGFSPLIIDKEKTQWMIRNKSPMPEPATATAGARVILKDHKNNLLVIEDKHIQGRWIFPGGSVEQKELPVLAAARELQEEVGLIVQPRDLTEVCRLTRTSANRYGYSDYAHFFMAKKCTGILTIDPKEISQAHWLPIDELASKESINNLKITPFMKALVAHVKNECKTSSSECIPDFRQLNKKEGEKDPKDLMYLQFFAQQ